MNGSAAISKLTRPSNPISSALRAAGPIAFQSLSGMPVSILIWLPPSRAPPIGGRLTGGRRPFMSTLVPPRPCARAAGFMPRYAYERLSAQDNTFLLMERSNVYMHVAATSVYEGGPLVGADGAFDIAAFRRAVEGFIHVIPRYREKLKWIPYAEAPVWVDDRYFNLDYHIRHTALPRPGNAAQLKKLAGRIMSQKLDRDRPLWEFWVVEGLEGRALRAHQQDPPLHDRRQRRRRSGDDPDVSHPRARVARDPSLCTAAGADRPRAAARRGQADDRSAGRDRSRPVRLRQARRQHSR